MSMDWSNEPYVRLYIRDTTTWRRLSWEAQALFPSLMKLLDRAGRLDLDGVPPVEAVSDALHKWPAPVIEAALTSLRESGVIEVTDVAILVPNFVEAQNTPRSDKARQAEVRARRRDEVRAAPRESAPNRAASRDADARRVTARDESSRSVTENHSPCAVPVPVLPALSSAGPPAASAGDIGDALDEPEVREIGQPVGAPTAGEIARAVELWDVRIQQRLAAVRARHTGSASERVAACSPNLRTDEAARNLHREVMARERGIDGVLEVLEWAWERFATAAWSGKQREEERKRIVFAFRGAATYWAGLVAERADFVAKAELAERAAKQREESDRLDAERTANARASPAEPIDIEEVTRRLRRRTAVHA